jgi:hypothetical protein
VNEAQLQQTVLEMCGWLGLLAYHTHDSRRSQPGFPDLVIAGEYGVLFRELKTDKGTLTDAQRQWANRLTGWDVWRPYDLASGRIKKELEAVR